MLIRSVDTDHAYGSCLTLGDKSDDIPQIFGRGVPAVCGIAAVNAFVGIVKSIVSAVVFCDADGVYHFADIVPVVVGGNYYGSTVLSDGVYGVRSRVGGHGYPVSPMSKVPADGYGRAAPSAAQLSASSLEITDQLRHALCGHSVSQSQQGVVHGHDLTARIFHCGQAEPDTFPLILILNKVTRGEKTGFGVSRFRKVFLIGGQIIAYLFCGDSDKSKKAQYPYHTAVWDVRDGTASGGKKVIFNMLDFSHGFLLSFFIYCIGSGDLCESPFHMLFTEIL